MYVYKRQRRRHGADEWEAGRLMEKLFIFACREEEEGKMGTKEQRVKINRKGENGDTETRNAQAKKPLLLIDQSIQRERRRYSNCLFIYGRGKMKKQTKMVMHSMKCYGYWFGMLISMRRRKGYQIFQRKVKPRNSIFKLKLKRSLFPWSRDHFVPSDNYK